MKKLFYLTLNEAMNATRGLGITSSREYKKRYKEDPLLPARPNVFYSNEWPSQKGAGWVFFLGEKAKKYYLTLEETINAARGLGITSSREYEERYKEDPLLPARPQVFYSDEWLLGKGAGWAYFFGRKVKEYYLTLAEARNAVRNLGITSNIEYGKRYKEDPLLPARPEVFYSDEWPIKNGYSLFYGEGFKVFYPTLAEARRAVATLGIKSKEQYLTDYKKDPHLPVDPVRVYSDELLVNNSFLFFLTNEVKTFYKTLLEAKAATASLGIISFAEYKERYKEDPHLPVSPKAYYSDEWPVKNGREFFFEKEVKRFYPTLAEAQEATVALSIQSIKEYSKRYKEDPRLPSDPPCFYLEEWKEIGSWHLFLKKDVRQMYLSIYDVKKAIYRMGITSQSEYVQRYTEDVRLPRNLSAVYGKEWARCGDFIHFCLPIKIESFNELHYAIKLLNIKNSKVYRDKRKIYKQLPSNPKRSFPADFIDWYHLCNIPHPYSYLELQSMVQKERISTIKQYQTWRMKNKDLRIPSDPDEKELYKNDWINWYVFFGKEEPFQPEYFHEPYIEWQDLIIEFMKVARGGGAKKLHLCKFVRLYVQKHELGFTPLEFVLNKRINISYFKDFLADEGYHSKVYNAADEFIDYIIRVKCSDEDPDTGEVVRMKDAKNRIKGILLPEGESRYTPDETVKPALSYQYVQALRSWTIPPDAKSFSDLAHLQIFESEWVTVPINTINVDDPDCVYKVVDDKFAKIWVPIYWMHTYTLFSVPLRGMQIAYNDSGEADSYLPEYANGQVVWKKNKGKLAGLTKNQGMIKRYPKDEFGMFSTSNKTSTNLGSQSVPWMPKDLAYWLIKLRKWQSKYNPIKAPKAWLDCERTSLNETQRKQKGTNCFLFRDFGVEECGTFGGRLANRLAVALYYSQPKDIQLATCNGKLNAVSRYKSEYTPHSMRVSLITIYVMEYNLDLSIIMKLAGHSSIVMSLYYVKTQGTALRKKIEEGEKIALKSQVKATQNLIEQLRIDEIKPNLVANSEATLKALNNNTPAGNYLFRDWGICPHAGARCEDGGELIGNTQARSPTPSGYLGGENCIRCRHFVTGPAFIGGLLAIFQEIILSLQAKQSHYDDLIEDESSFLRKLEVEDEEEYLCNKNGKKFDSSKRIELLGYIRKTKSEYEVVAKKMDVLYCDLGAVSTLVHQCQALLNQTNYCIDNDQGNLQLIVRTDHELQVIAEEVSQYELLCEVCENAEIYQSASADLAITPRSQLIDKMMLRNKIEPQLFNMTPKQQLKAGNQLNRLFKERLKNHTQINDLIEGKLLLSDLSEHERIKPIDLINVFKQQRINIKEV